MKKRYSILTFLLLASSMYGFSQTEEKDLNEYFFMSFHSTTYLDYTTSPVRIERGPTGNYIPQPDGSLLAEYAEIPSQTGNINLFSIGLEPRFNLRELSDNSAFAVSMPFSLGVGNSYPLNKDVNGVIGIGSIQIPLMAKLYLGSGSTYRSEKDYGISIGVGLEMNKTGLIRMDQVDEEGGAVNRAWVQPVVSLGIHFWRGYYPVEINLKYGVGQLETYYLNRYGQPILHNGVISSASGRATSFRGSISYLLNY